jgi:hypothetical protein
MSVCRLAADALCQSWPEKSIWKILPWLVLALGTVAVLTLAASAARTDRLLFYPRGCARLQRRRRCATNLKDFRERSNFTEPPQGFGAKDDDKGHHGGGQRNPEGHHRMAVGRRFVSRARAGAALRGYGGSSVANPHLVTGRLSRAGALVWVNLYGSGDLPSAA